MAQQATEQADGYSALDTPMTGGGDGSAREPFPLGSFYFSFQNLIRGLKSAYDEEGKPPQERCKFVFRCEEVIRARKWTPSAEFPKPRSPQDFVGEEYHHYENFYSNPKPRMNIHKVISAIIGHHLEQSEPFVPREYIDSWVEVTIGLNENNNPKIMDFQPYIEEVEDTNDGFEPEPEPVAPVGRGRRSAPPTNGQPFL